MDAANPLCRFVMLAVGLFAVIGCKSDDPRITGYPARSTEEARLKWNREHPDAPANPDAPQPAVVRPQMPTEEPLGPIAPPPMPVPNTPVTPIAPLTPSAPSAPGAPSGVVPASPGAPIPGSPVTPTAKGPTVVQASGVKNVAVGVERIKQSVPRVKVVAIVGANNVVTDREVIENVWQQNEELAKLEGHARAAKEKELYTLALRKTIERELILDDMYAKLKKANKMNVIEEIKDVAVQMTDKQFREMKRKIGGKTDDDLAAFLRIQGLTLPVLRRQFERQIMAQQYINSMLKEKGRRAGLAEIRDYYDKHPDEFRTPDLVKWQHIFVSFGNPQNPRAAAGRMEAIRKQLAAQDFATVSTQLDEGFAKRQKGFGVGEKRGEIQPLDLEQTVWELKPGQVSNAIQTPTGYHLVKVVEREYAGVRPFDPKVQAEIREKINRRYYDEDEARLVEELWRKGVVRVIDE